MPLLPFLPLFSLCWHYACLSSPLSLTSCLHHLERTLNTCIPFSPSPFSLPFPCHHHTISSTHTYYYTYLLSRQDFILEWWRWRGMGVGPLETHGGWRRAHHHTCHSHVLYRHTTHTEHTTTTTTTTTGSGGGQAFSVLWACTLHLCLPFCNLHTLRLSLSLSLLLWKGWSGTHILGPCCALPTSLAFTTFLKNHFIYTIYGHILHLVCTT